MNDLSFSAVVNENTRLLILGSLPGKVSIAKQAYYAHPRNALWPILAEVFQFDAHLSYNQRLVMAKQAGVGFWDVVASAARKGSLDSQIRSDSVLYNPIDELVLKLPNLKRVLLNGTKAAQLFKKAGFDRCLYQRQIDCQLLPSTSPANASISLAQKKLAWQTALMNTH